jgi:hypothetical protein
MPTKDGVWRKRFFGNFKDELVEVFGWHAKRIHQGRLDSAGHFGDPGFVVTAFDDVDFGERHGCSPLLLGYGRLQIFSHL